MCVELRAVPVVLEGSLPGAAQTMRKQNQIRTLAKFLAIKKIKYPDAIDAVRRSGILIYALASLI